VLKGVVGIIKIGYVDRGTNAYQGVVFTDHPCRIDGASCPGTEGPFGVLQVLVGAVIITYVYCSSSINIDRVMLTYVPSAIDYFRLPKPAGVGSIDEVLPICIVIAYVQVSVGIDRCVYYIAHF